MAAFALLYWITDGDLLFLIKFSAVMLILIGIGVGIWALIERVTSLRK
jgi:ABC-type proline/glycine betaine transport system permease subunit